MLSPARVDATLPRNRRAMARLGDGCDRSAVGVAKAMDQRRPPKSRCRDARPHGQRVVQQVRSCAEVRVICAIGVTLVGTIGCRTRAPGYQTFQKCSAWRDAVVDLLVRS